MIIHASEHGGLVVDIPLPVANHDANTVTFAVTFQWRKPWAMDHCELYGLCGTIKRLLRDGLIAEEYNHQLAAILAVETWEPREERHIGSARGLGVGPIVLPTPPRIRGGLMDPEATWRDVNDLRDDLRTRSESALALLCWLAKGGFCPGDSGCVPVVETCHALIVGYIDTLESA